MDVAPALAGARRFLADARNADGAWGYTKGAVSAAEPTVLCAGAGAGLAESWLDANALGFAMLLLPGALSGTPGAATRRDAATAAVLGQASATLANETGPVVLDATLVGWSWVEGTFGWVEPTAYAVVSLRRAGKADHPRVVEGQRFLIDRKCADGGWNYGNPVAFDVAMPADLAPTAWAGLALTGDPAAESAFDVVQRALVHPSTLGLAAALLLWTGPSERRAHPIATTLADALVARQREDGSFGGRVDWTALAVCGLDALVEQRPHVFAP